MFFGDQFFQAEQQQWEENRHLMEMVEEDVEVHPTAEGVEQPPYYGITLILHKPPQVEKSGQRGQSRLKNQQRRHQMRQKAIWKWQGQPEKRAEKQIEAVRTDKVGSKVGIPVPEDVSGAHRIVGKHVERDLLHVKIPLIDKIAPVMDDEGDKDQSGGEERKKKCLRRQAPVFMGKRWSLYCHNKLP